MLRILLWIKSSSSCQCCSVEVRKSATQASLCLVAFSLATLISVKKPLNRELALEFEERDYKLDVLAS